LIPQLAAAPAAAKPIAAHPTPGIKATAAAAPIVLPIPADTYSLE